MDFWNILQKLKKCNNLTKSALGGVPCLNTERLVLICLSPTGDQLTAANCMICSVDVWLPMEPTFFLQGSQCKSL